MPPVLDLATLKIPFDDIFKSVTETTLTTFAVDESASVQATMFKMGEKIINDNADVADVSYSLPNKHYFAVDMSYKGIANTKPADAEVFMPVSDPSGLITATMTRSQPKHGRAT